MIRDLVHALSRAHRAETVRQRALCRGRRAGRAARAESRWLAKRPFSDKHGYDGIGFGGASGWRGNDGRDDH